jgi:GAF domain-containing protein
MFDLKKPDGNEPKTVQYANLEVQLRNLLGDERNFIANAANMCALVYHGLPDLNWAGFYLFKEGQLVLGPFQGKPACVRIRIGKGVCGAAAIDLRIMVVEDVHEFPGHIACDAASRSEVVAPIVKDGRFIGVFDVDSPVRGRLDKEDGKGMERLVETFVELTDCTSL